MAIQVILYKMDKRTNSTIRPSGPGNPYTVELKDACSVVDPVLVFNFGQQDYPSGFNYVQIPIFENRCYWVTNWQYFRGLWSASCQVDVLASWRDYIGASTQYVLRAAADYNGGVVDGLYPTIAGYTTQKISVDSPFDGNVDHGTYILSTVCSGFVGFGGLSYWNLSETAFNEFRKLLLSSTDYLDIDSIEVSADLTKALFNPYQYCVNCYWFPFSFPFGPIHNKIGIGWWTLRMENDVSIVTAGFDVAYIYKVFSVPKHPQSARRGKFLNLSPYSDYVLFFPPFGEIAIDGSKIVDSERLYVKILVDAYTGTGYIFVSTDDPGDNLNGMAKNIIAVRSAQIGVPIALAQLSYNVVDSVGELIPLAVSALSGLQNGLYKMGSAVGETVNNLLSGDFSAAKESASGIGGSITSNVVSAVLSKQTDVQYKGSCGSAAVYNTSPYLLARFASLVDEDNEDRGRPLCQMRQISSLPGFQMVADPDVAIPATKAETDAIKQYMSTGFFWE